MTTATIRPTGDVSWGPGIWTLTGAAAAWVATSDDGDGSWLRAGDSGQTWEQSLGSTAIASDQRIKQVRTRARIEQPDATSRWEHRLALSGQYTAWDVFTGPRTIGEVVGAWRTVAPDGGEWTQSKIDALNARFRDRTSGGASVGTKVVEIYVDVDLNEQPTVTVDEPSTDVTDTSQPTVEWTYADADSDAQTLARVKVFHPDVWGDAAFDPDTSAAVWDSGDLAGTVASAQVGVYLLDQTTYRAYVKVAQDFNGQPWWSEWAYIEFATDFDPPPAPTIDSATFDVATNSVDVQVQGATDLTVFDEQQFTIERSDDGQVTWTEIRVSPIGGEENGQLQGALDYEAPRGQQVHYRARAVAIRFDQVLASDWSAAVAVTVTNDGEWWLKDPNDPTVNIGGVRVIEGLDVTVEEALGVFRPRGRDRAVVVAGEIYGRDGTYEIVTSTPETWEALEPLVMAQRTLFVQDPFGDQKYVRWISRADLVLGTPTAPRHRITLGYVEVDTVSSSSPNTHTHAQYLSETDHDTYARHGAGSVDHGQIDGLGDDDHPQYVLRTLLTTQGDLFKRGAAGIERLALGSALQVLRVNAAGTDLEYAAPAAGGLTLEGSNTTEQSTTSNTAVDLKTLSGLSIPTSKPVLILIRVGIDGQGSNRSIQVGMKINGTLVWGTGSFNAVTAMNRGDGMLQVIAGPRKANYQNGAIGSYVGDNATPTFFNPRSSAAWPNATITSVTIQALVNGSPNGIAYVGDVYVYSLSDS